MAVLGDLLIRMAMDSAEMRSDMNKTFGVVDKFGKDVSKVFGGLKDAVGALGIGLTALEIKGKLDSTIEAADHLNDLSKTTRISVENLAGLRLLADQTGSDLDSLSQSVMRLQVNMGKTPDKFKAIGISAKDPIEAFKQMADYINAIEDSDIRAAVAQTAFGKAWQGAAPAISEGSVAMQRAIEEGRKLSGMTTELGVRADEYKDELARLKVASEAFWNHLVNDLLPVMTTMVRTYLAAKAAAEGFGGAVLRFFMISGAEANNPAKALEEIGDQIRKTEKQLEEFRGKESTAASAYGRAQENSTRWLKSLLSTDDIVLLEGKLKALEMKRAVLEKLLPAPALPPAPKPDTRGAGGFVKEDTATARLVAAELKLYQGAAQKLEEQLFGLNHQSNEAKLIYETTIGSLHTLTQGHKDLLVQRAADIDRLQTSLAMQKQQREGMDAEVKLRETLMGAVNAARFAYEDENREAAFQLGLIGRNAAETERMIALHKIDLDVRRQLAAVPSGEGIDSSEATNEILKRAEEQKRVVLDNIHMRREAERNWVTGARAAFNDYIDAASNGAVQARDLFNNAFRSMEDALISFVKTGKLDFKSLADSIITDLIRIQIKQAVLKPMSNWMNGGESSGMLGSIGAFLAFGSKVPGDGEIAAATADGTLFQGWASGGPVWSGQSGWVGENGPEWLNAGTPGYVTPNSEIGGMGGTTVYIDATGADAAGLARVEAQLRTLDATIEHRAVAATVDAGMRGRTDR